VLVVTDPGDPFGTYYAEILRAEGLNEFAVTDTGNLDAATLAGYQVVVLAQTAVTDAQTTALTNWVQGGGNLIAMRPDARLDGLLGLGARRARSATATSRSTPPRGGRGITADTMQFHGTADVTRRPTRATVATLYSSASASTSRPAVTLRSVGSAGGQAAAFTYDLARSIVATRQGNIAWAGQKRDGQIEPHPLRRPLLPRLAGLQQGADPAGRRAAAPAGQPHHADEPRPHAAAALLVPAARREGGGRPDRRRPRPRRHHRAVQPLRAASPAGCSVADWQCVRSTSYVYPGTDITDAQARAFQAPASRSPCT
jgi:hypothetical protein